MATVHGRSRAVRITDADRPVTVLAHRLRAWAWFGWPVTLRRLIEDTRAGMRTRYVPETWQWWLFLASRAIAIPLVWICGLVVWLLWTPGRQLALLTLSTAAAVAVSI